MSVNCILNTVCFVAFYTTIYVCLRLVAQQHIFIYHNIHKLIGMINAIVVVINYHYFKNRIDMIIYTSLGYYIMDIIKLWLSDDCKNIKEQMIFTLHHILSMIPLCFTVYFTETDINKNTVIFLYYADIASIFYYIAYFSKNMKNWILKTSIIFIETIAYTYFRCFCMSVHYYNCIFYFKKSYMYQIQMIILGLSILLIYFFNYSIICSLMKQFKNN